MIPPDVKTFLTQARQQGFKPKVVTVGKALLFPGAIEALGDLGDGLSTEVWWSPSHPFKSSLTEQSAKAARRGVRERRPRSSGRSRSASCTRCSRSPPTRSSARKDVGDKAAMRDAIAATNLDTIVGPVEWGGQGPVKNVTQDAAGAAASGCKGKKYKYELIDRQQPDGAEHPDRRQAQAAP